MNRRQLLATTTAIAATSVCGFARPANSDNAATRAAVRGSLRRLTNPGAGDNRATFMPDGKTILFVSKRSGASQIWQMGRDGSHPKQVHHSVANDYGRVAPNANGSRLCFSSDRSGQNAVYVLDLATDEVTLISDRSVWSFGPTWSAHDLIAFFSKKGGNAINVWTVRPDGAQARQITDQPGESRQPWWSPDGEMLAISADHGTGVFQLWLLKADGSPARQITSRGSYQQPFWSPDGRTIAVSASIDEPHHRIYVMDADGSNLQPIQQPEDVNNIHPAWSPDGRSIVFTSGDGPAASLYAFELE